MCPSWHWGTFGPGVPLPVLLLVIGWRKKLKVGLASAVVFGSSVKIPAPDDRRNMERVQKSEAGDHQRSDLVKPMSAGLVVCSCLFFSLVGFVSGTAG